MGLSANGEREYGGTLSYQGVDYQVSTKYDVEQNKTKLHQVFLENTETGEAICIFYDGISGDEIFSPEALIYHRGLDEKISYTLPEELLETEDRFNTMRASRMFCQEEKQKNGIYGTRWGCLWNTAGGLTQALLAYRKEERTVDLYFGAYTGVSYTDSRSNDRRTAMGSAVREFRGGELHNIDGCENMTSLQGLVFHKNAIDDHWLIWCNQKEAGKLTKK